MKIRLSSLLFSLFSLGAFAVDSQSMKGENAPKKDFSYHNPEISKFTGRFSEDRNFGVIVEPKPLFSAHESFEIGESISFVDEPTKQMNEGNRIGASDSHFQKSESKCLVERD